MSDYKYPENLIKKLETRIEKQLDGHPASIKDLNLTIKRQGLGQFSARTSYDLDTSVQTAKKPGRLTSGTVIESKTAEKEIQSYLTKLKDKKSIQTLLAEQIKTLPNQGFSVDKHVIPIDSEKTSFITHDPCTNCQGKGQTPCAPCQSTGRQNCVPCHTTGLMHCVVCQGKGTVVINGQQQHCTQCQGKGRTICTYCHGQKTIVCQHCQGKGHSACKPCNAQGYISTIYTINAIAKTKAQINIQELDNDPKRMVSLVKPQNLAKGGHIPIQISKPPKEEEDNTAWYEDKKVTDRTGVFYSVTVPWAVAEITYKNKPMDIHLVGNKGAVAECGNFMDLVLQPLTAMVAQCNRNKEAPFNVLNQISQFRVSRETIESLTKRSRKKTMVMVHKKWGLGLSKQCVKDIVLGIKKLTDLATKKYRYIGYSVGLALAAAIGATWFYQIRPADVHIGIDIGIGVGALVLIGLGGFIGSKIGYKKLLGHIGPN